MYLLPFTLQVREEIQLANLANQYLRDMIKKECWTAMAVKGRSVNAFHLPLSVSNYPMKERTKAELEEVQYVTNQRKIEEAEADSSKKVASGPTSARNTPLVGKNTSTCATGRKADKRRDRQTNGRTDGRTKRQTDRQTNKQIDRTTDGRTDGWADKHTDRESDRKCRKSSVSCDSAVTEDSKRPLYRVLRKLQFNHRNRTFHSLFQQFCI